MPTFVHPAILWGLLIVGLPVLIHLINMLRRRRVEWAAMEFLLKSRRKNRTKVLLRQLLLLLMRMLAVAAIVLMLAGPRIENEWAKLFGGGRVHHVVLLDDSYSMNDRTADSSAFDLAKSVVERIATRASGETGGAWFTLLRFSKARDGGNGVEPDFLETSVGDEFGVQLQETLRKMNASQTAAGPREAIEGLEAMLEESAAEQHIVYLVSDFRETQWDESEDIRDTLARLEEKNVLVRFIDCVDAPRANLAVVDVRPAEGIRAAGVPMTMEVEVGNHGATTASDVVLFPTADGLTLPNISFPTIPPGETRVERFPVTFSEGGEHIVSARLENDPIEDDNTRRCVIDLSDDIPVLLIDGGLEPEDARYVAAALAPTGQVRTGVRPRIETPRFLVSQPLDEYRTIFLLNVDHLEKSAVAAIERFVKGGGGLCVFVGPRSDAAHMNEAWRRDGEGFLPVPIAGQDVLLVDRLRKAPDLRIESHPIFSIFEGARNTFLSTVTIERYMAPESPLPEDLADTTKVIARLRDGVPIAFESRLGEGRVLTFLTTAAPTWNNWARGNPSFVVAILEIQSYLASGGANETPRLVGSPLEIEYDSTEYGSRVRFVAPGERGGEKPSAVDGRRLEGTTMQARLADTDRGGVYRAELARVDGSTETRQFAVNVDPDEGRTPTLDGVSLADRLPGVTFDYYRASEFEFDADDLQGYNLAGPLLFLLLALLLAEQAMAYWTGYHPPRRSAGAEEGGRA